MHDAADKPTPTPEQQRIAQLGLMRRTPRPRSVGAAREIGFEDRLQDQPQGTLNYAIANRGDRDHAHLAAFLRNLSSSIRSRPIRSAPQFGGELFQKLAASCGLDRRERLAVAAWGAAFALRLQVSGFERVVLHEVDVHAPEAVRRGGFRPMAYLRLKLLQTDGGLYHPAPALLLAPTPRPTWPTSSA
ncbi:hypothetical protein [Sorangium cellulosum]|uniref:hypothetical protein n=1 Tax=Sorangium cellulosum TaxID=56 RepID=UPI0030B868DC